MKLFASVAFVCLYLLHCPQARAAAAAYSPPPTGDGAAFLSPAAAAKALPTPVMGLGAVLPAAAPALLFYFLFTTLSFAAAPRRGAREYVYRTGLSPPSPQT